jgi:acetylornithine aminotransferase
VDVRGKGLILGVEMTREALPIAHLCLEKGFLVSPAGPRVLRLLPALTVDRNAIERALEILDQVLGTLSS